MNKSAQRRKRGRVPAILSDLQRRYETSISRGGMPQLGDHEAFKQQIRDGAKPKED